MAKERRQVGGGVGNQVEQHAVEANRGKYRHVRKIAAGADTSRNSHQQIARMGNGAVAEQPSNVALGDGHGVADGHGRGGEGRDQHRPVQRYVKETP